MTDALTMKRSRPGRPRLPQLLIFVTIIVAAVAAIAGAVAFSLTRDGSDSSATVITGVRFPYPAGWEEQPLTEDDTNAGIILRVNNGDPEASFLARTLVARLAADFEISRLGEETAAALASQVEGFELAGEELVTIGTLPAVRLTYLQTDADGQVYQTLMVIVPQENQTFYLTLRSKEPDFRRAEREGSELINSFVAYIEAAAAAE
jgi:hypothetical protein